MASATEYDSLIVHLYEWMTALLCWEGENAEAGKSVGVPVWGSHTVVVFSALKQSDAMGSDEEDKGTAFRNLYLGGGKEDIF